MLMQQTNLKMYKSISSETMIKQLLNQKLVKVQRDELNRLNRLNRYLYPAERYYIVRMYQDMFGLKSQPNSLVTNTDEQEKVINSFEDISFLN